MPPQIALSLCILFILYVFRMNCKQKPEVSNALWVPLIWMLIISSRTVAQWINPGYADAITTSAYEEGSPIDRFIYSTLIFIGIFILSKRSAALSSILKNNRWIFLWFLYCGISIVWSDFPGVAFKRWIKGIGTVMMALVVMTEPDPVESLKTLVKRCAYVLIPLSILLIKYYRYLGVGYNPWDGTEMFTGVGGNKNVLGRLCLVTGIFFFYNIITSWRIKKELVDYKKDIFINVIFLFMILWLLIKSNSATSLATFLIGCCIFLALGLRIIKSNVKYIGTFILLFVVIFIILGQFYNLTEVLVESLGRNMTFTDRTYLWKDLLSIGTNSVIGTGYDSFWLGSRLEKLWSKYSWLPNESHNGYLETYLELGLVGLALLAGFVVNTYSNIRRSLMYEFDYGRLRMAILVIVLLYNVMESAFKGVALIWFVFLVISIDPPRKSQVETSWEIPKEETMFFQ